MADETWRCGRCDVPLTVKKTELSYLGRTVTHDIECCPKCGKVFIPMELAEGRMRDAECQLEDK